MDLCTFSPWEAGIKVPKMGKEKLIVLLSEDFHLQISSARQEHQPIYEVMARHLAGEPMLSGAYVVSDSLPWV